MEQTSSWIQEFVVDITEGDSAENSNYNINVVLPSKDDKDGGENDTYSADVVEEVLDSVISEEDIVANVDGNVSGQDKGKAKGKNK